MARLVLKSQGFGGQVILMRMGVNRLGRTSDNDFSLEHPSVSSRHCEIILSNDGLRVRDCQSTNGTFLNDEPVTEAVLEAGQTLRLGDVELFVEDTEVRVGVPKFDAPQPAPPIVAAGGAMMCRTHEARRATYQCTHCREILCEQCVHTLRRRKGTLLLLCPRCSHPCHPLGPATGKKKRGLLGFLLKTVKLPLPRSSASNQ